MIENQVFPEGFPPLGGVAIEAAYAFRKGTVRETLHSLGGEQVRRRGQNKEEGQ
jgi:hypothetical protein